MRQVTRKSLVSVAAVGGVLALASGTAHAGSSAEGGAQGSPGVLSGNNVQAPVHVPVNACGNTVSVVGLLNPAIGNKCANVSEGHQDKGGSQKGDSGYAAQSDRAASPQNQTRHGGEGSQQSGGASAQGEAQGSPGVLSGNNVQAPVDVPVNACGNSVNVVGLLNPAIGNECANDIPQEPAPEKPEPKDPHTPEKPEQPKPEEPKEDTPEQRISQPRTQLNEPETQTELAQTGAPALSTTAPVAIAMMLGGYVLYRRGRVSQR